MNTSSEVAGSLSQPLLDYPYPQPTVLPAPESPVLAEGTSRIVLSLTTTSLAAHLLVIAWVGAGLSVPARPVRTKEAPVAPIQIENVSIEEPPTPVAPPPPKEIEKLNTPSAPQPAAPLDLPPLAALQPIAAVPASVAVAFGLGADGPVRLVGNAAAASSGASGRRLAEPLVLDFAGEQNLVLPSLPYPSGAKRLRQSGSVWIEFRTNTRGEISDVRVRQSSGYPLLDEAAADNLRAGRWKGRPGYYAKAFEFKLR